LRRETSINSHLKLYKEKEMADFRKIFYAVAMPALFVGLSATAYAQQCDVGSVVPPDLRQEGRAELVGDILIRCTGGTPTPAGNIVPSVNIRVQLNTAITSQLLGNAGGGENEVLLIVDEPNSGRYAPNNMLPGQTGERGLLACGQTGAPDNSPSGLNVCRIVAPTHPSRTYDGLANGWTGQDNQGNSYTCTGTDPDGEGPAPVTPAPGTFGCGRPNVFQGHYVGSVTSARNIIEFSGVPFDPPGNIRFNSADDDGSPNKTPWVRTFRIVNIRVDASSTSAPEIFANVAFSGDTQASVDNANNILVARNRFPAFLTPTASGTGSFIQCIEKSISEQSLSGIRNNPRTFPSTYIRFTEGFDEAWKVQGWAQIQANSLVNITGGGNYGAYDEGFDVPSTYIRQNVPGAIYHTESGFSAPGGTGFAGPAGQNPPVGTGFQIPPTGLNQTISNSTGVATAGVATNGTRLQIVFNNIPTGVTLYTPEVVYLTRKGTNVVTGIAIRNSATDPRQGAFVSPSSPSPTDWQAIGTNRLAVYEMFYVDYTAEEDMTVPIGIATNLSQLPQSITTATTVSGGLAPIGTPLLALFSSDSNGRLPRFVEDVQQAGSTLFTLEKCNCNLLFPFVSNASGFDTGIAIANTSLSPTDPTYIQTLPQSGPVQFWYFAGGSMVRTECTNAANKGVCPGTTFVPAGGVMTFTAYHGSNTWGLNGAPSGFTGYMIAKTGFQYCHGFAYFSDLNRAVIPGVYGTSVGYLALVMDPTRYTYDEGYFIINANPRTVNSVADGLDQ
jgi:hypothetical protein